MRKPLVPKGQELRYSSKEELQRQHHIDTMKLKLGLFIFPDDTDKNIRVSSDYKIFTQIVTVYSSYEEYSSDKAIANKLIDSGVQLPCDLEYKLIKTKEELEAAGVKHKY